MWHICQDDRLNGEERKPGQTAKVIATASAWCAI